MGGEKAEMTAFQHSNAPEIGLTKPLRRELQAV
jgi:hypothetical protein